MLAVDFFTVETIWRQRLYVLFFIELGSRRVHVAGCTPNPSGPWVAQPARQLTWALGDRPAPVQCLIRDQDQKFTDSFDGVFRGDRIQIIRTPFRTPQANGVAERFVRTVRSACLDWLLIVNDQQLEHVLHVFTTHDNSHRPHRALTLTPPQPMHRTVSEWTSARVQRRNRLGGLIHEYWQDRGEDPASAEDMKDFATHRPTYDSLRSTCAPSTHRRPTHRRSAPAVPSSSRDPRRRPRAGRRHSGFED
jgi:putative transposase